MRNGLTPKAGLLRHSG